MLMRKCDRCGVYYENDSKCNRTIIYGMVNDLGFIDQTRTLRRYDVCDNCVKIFIKWMTNEEITDEELKCL